jgi:hypothetical protein
MRKSNLILHCGASAVDREALANVVTPAKTATWQPIPHAQLLTGVQRSLERAGLVVVNEAHGLTKGGARYFGLLQMAAGDDHDSGLVVGLRNSHDKSFPAGLVVGSAVFVCDNLSFSGEVKLARKHTVNIERDLPGLIDGAVGRLGTLRRLQEQRFGAYKTRELTDAQAHDLLVQALDARVIPVTKLPDVLTEWRTPRHSEFAATGKTAWRLFNAFTESLKGNLDLLPKRTGALHGLLDVVCGLAVQNATEIQAANAV